MLDDNEFRTGVGIAYGRTHGWGIAHHDGDANGPERISFGHHYSSGSWTQNINGPFSLTPSGTFNLGYIHGWRQRDALARNTFLIWSHFIGGYQWMVDTGHDPGNHDSYWAKWARDYQRRRPYMREWTFRSGYADKDTWFDLLPVNAEPGWQMWPSKVTLKSRPWLQTHFEYHARLREKRWARYERQDLIAAGVLAPPPPRAARLTDEEREERTNRVAVTIAAHLTTEMPANNRKSRSERKEPAWQLFGTP